MNFVNSISVQNVIFKFEHRHDVMSFSSKLIWLCLFSYMRTLFGSLDSNYMTQLCKLNISTGGLRYPC